MAKFLTALDVCCLDDGLWRLDAPLVYESDELACIVEVPAGFVTDFASVPRVPFVYMLWGDRAHHEAVIHDYLYRIDSAPVVVRERADAVFLEAMQCRGKSCFVCRPMYLGVRLGGGNSYHQRRVDWAG